jgi:hypothetical protein
VNDDVLSCGDLISHQREQRGDQQRQTVAIVARSFVAMKQRKHFPHPVA